MIMALVTQENHTLWVEKRSKKESLSPECPLWFSLGEVIIASNSECYIFQNCNLLQMGVQTCYRRCITGLTIWPRGLLVLPAAP